MARNVVILWEKTMPAGFSCPLTQRIWRLSTEGMTVRFASLSNLESSLERADLFINPYGAAFPLEAWPTILRYLEKGGNFLNWGGVPFRTPVSGFSIDNWRTQRSCANYHRKIGIVQSYIYSPEDGEKIVSHHPRLDRIVKEKSFVCPDTYPLTVRSQARAVKTNDNRYVGNGGAEYQALVHSAKSGAPVAAPITRMDRYFSPWAGGRWIFVTMNLGQLSGSELNDWVAVLPILIKMAAEGATTLDVIPTLATYLIGHVPALRISVRNGSNLGENLSVNLTIVPPKGKSKSLSRKIDPKPGSVNWFEIPLPITCDPGFYSVRARLRNKVETLESAISGFWGRDKKLMAQGAPLKTDGEMILRDGEIYPLIGSSYMVSDSDGGFLWRANPGAWDRDFSDMTDAEIRVVRTGLWGGGPHYIMPEPGVWREDALRALDAFVLTAQRHRIPLLLSFFSSTPPSFGGENRYLDPGSLAAQEEFIRILVTRYKNCPGIIWDLINEPKGVMPAEMRPHRDRWEMDAWRVWLRKRYTDINELREVWHVRSDEVSSFDTAPLATDEDFNVDWGTLGRKRPFRAQDYIEFSREVFSNWVRHMAAVVRSTGSDQLLTAEQSAGACMGLLNISTRDKTLDFTSARTCWQSDSALWERIAAKTFNMPNVVKETEAIYIENLDGEARRTEAQSAAILERKCLYALATASAGTIHWQWQSHNLMPNENEARAGLARADGAKNSAHAAHRRMTRFWWENRNQFVNREADPITLVLPSGSKYPFQREILMATRRSLQVLTKALHIGVRAINEESLAELGLPKMTILASPCCLSDEGWKALVAYVEKGGTLVMSGVVERDLCQRITSRLGEVGIPGLGPALVAPQELMFMSGDQFLLTYSGCKPQWLEREVWSGEASVWECHLGKGSILYSPLPLELADQFAPTVHFYSRSMEMAGIESRLLIEDYIPTTYIRLMRYRDVDLVVAVNEASDPVSMGFTIRDIPGAWRIELQAQRGGAYLIHRDKAQLIDEY